MLHIIISHDFHYTKLSNFLLGHYNGNYLLYYNISLFILKLIIYYTSIKNTYDNSLYMTVD